MPAPTESHLIAKIVEWDPQRRFGFLQVGKQRVFLHRRDFVEHHKRPAVGDVIRFTMGKDANHDCDIRGRPEAPAKEVREVRVRCAGSGVRT